MDFDFIKNLTVAELNELAEAVKEQKSINREAEKEQREAEKAERAAEMKDKVYEGAHVTFLYGRKNEEFEGTVVRASEKSATIQAQVFADHSKDGKDKKYVRYDRIISVGENVQEVAS